MHKERRSITIDANIAKSVDSQAEKEKRSFSNMIEVMSEDYLKRAAVSPQSEGKSPLGNTY